MAHSHEDRLLAAVAHGSIVVQGIGMIVGVVIYLQRREKHPWLAAQALQAAVYQLIAVGFVVAAWIVWTVLYMLSLIPVISFAETDPDTSMLWMIAGLVSMVVPFLVMVVVALYGLWGAWRVWQGNDFRYAVLGGLVYRMLGNVDDAAEAPQAGG